MNGAELGIVLDSERDLLVMQDCIQLIGQFGVQYELDILNSHHDPDRMVTYGKTAHSRGLKVIIASASGGAHLPSMLASLTPVPIIGVPIRTPNSLDGVDAIYSILQMPEGVPVGTMALNGARNAAIFALQILGCKHPSFYDLVMGYKNKLRDTAQLHAKNLLADGYEAYVQKLKP